MTPPHGPNWADEDDQWDAFRPEPKHLAERPGMEARHPVVLALILLGWVFLFAAAIAGIVRVMS